MDVLVYVLDEVGGHAAEGSLSTALVEDFAVTAGLNHCHIVFLLVLGNLAADAHTFGENLHNHVVKLVNLLAQGVEALSGLDVVITESNKLGGGSVKLTNSTGSSITLNGLQMKFYIYGGS